MTDFMTLQAERKIRIFISSTFKDMMQEREFLLKRIFPQLHRWCRERHIEMTEVDLRWGITEQEAKEGKVIEICLSEIDKSRPFFIGILGNRYGWVPDAAELNKQKRLFDSYPWIKADISNSLSITDIEMQYGVLRSPQMQGKAFFYIKEQREYELLEQTEEDEDKLNQLKTAVKSQKNFPVKEYSSVEELGEFVFNHMKSVIEQEYPDVEIPSELQKKRMEHIGFMKSRSGIYIKNKQMFSLLDQHAGGEAPPLVLSGESGTGKSALLSNWLMEYNQCNPNQYLLFHFCSSNSDSTDTSHMLARLLEEINEHFSLNERVPSDLNEMAEALPYFLAKASSWGRWIFVIDALNQLDNDSLFWLPKSFPSYVRVIVSVTPGKTLEEIRKRKWKITNLPLLDKEQRTLLIQNYLKQYSKKLDAPIEKAIVDCPLAKNALVLRTMLDELRVFGLHEGLPAQVNSIVKVKSTEAFFSLILKRLEIDYYETDSGAIRELLTLIWSSQKGLSEHEIMDIMNIPRLLLSQMLSELDSHLISLDGLLCFSHSFLRSAVEQRYLKTEKAKRVAHKKLLAYFEQSPYDKRSLEELPYQFRKANEWKKLKSYLIDLNVFNLIYSDNPYRLCFYWKELSERFDRLVAYRSSFHRNTGSALNIQWELADYLGSFLELCSDYKGAAYFYKISLKLCIEQFGKNHKQTALVYSKLAGIYNKLNYYGKSLYAAKNSLKVQKELLGEHPDMVDNYNNIADIFWKKGELKNSLRYNENALALCLKYLGADHEKTAETYQEIGWVYEAQGEYHKALENLLKASEIFQKRFGENSPQAANCYTSLAWVYDWLGDYSTLFELAEKSHLIFEYIYGEAHSETGIAYKLLGTGYYRLGDYAKACACYEKTKSIWISIYGQQHLRPAAACFQVGLACIKRKEYQRAIEEIETSIQIEKAVLGADAADLAINYNHLGIACSLAGDYNKGFETLNSALTEATQHYGRVSNDVAESNYYLSIYYLKKEEYQQSINHSLEAYDIRKLLYGEEHPETALSLYFIGRLLERIGSADSKEEYSTKAIAIFTVTKTLHLKDEIDDLFLSSPQSQEEENGE